jgi:hypothetical protein
MPGTSSKKKRRCSIGRKKKWRIKGKAAREMAFYS